MRIVQLIDSLEAGGAERMAVNYANALVGNVKFSGLISTRFEGSLKNELKKDVNYICLNKKRTFDSRAIRKLYNYCKINEVNFIHAHSTSVFLAVVIKLRLPRIKIIWHDHYGNSEFLSDRPSRALKFLLPFCSGAIAVNSKLENWIKTELNFSNTIYLSNFAVIDIDQISTTKLEGVTGKRIVSLANLREQKNHLLLLDVAAKLKPLYPDWTFHFIGKDFKDETAAKIRRSIIEKELVENVFIYGSCTDTVAILKQAEIAVLSSNSEGLPLAILEYGLLGKAVISTDVGEIPAIINHGSNGFLVKTQDSQQYYETVKKLILEPQLRSTIGRALKETVQEAYSESAVIDRYVNWVKKC